MKKIKKVRQGAASFYIVIFSTLILLVVVAGFTALVVAQITRTSNDDLSQSAYDAALAGIEDAKLAYYNYQACLAGGAESARGFSDRWNCGAIIYAMEHPEDEEVDCNFVGSMLGRNVGENGVPINEGRENNMQEWYTCVKIETSLKDYRGSLSPKDPIRVIKVRLDDSKGEDATLDRIKTMRVSWGSTKEDAARNFLAWSGSGRDNYPSARDASTNPPVLGVALVQAGDNFSMSQFDASEGDRTNRGLIYLVPQASEAANGIIAARDVAKSNDKTMTNKASTVNCSDKVDAEFACSVDIELPEPVNGPRGIDNFMVAVMLPYGSATDFALEFFCAEGESCGTERVVNDGVEQDVSTHQANLKGQIRIDSTGRANDLFRRVEVRIGGTDSFAISLMGPLELWNMNSGGGGGGGSTGNDVLLQKDYSVTCEWNFGGPGDSCLQNPNQ